MSSPFELRAEFSPGEHGSAEVRATTAELTVLVEGESLTRVDDAWARSVRDHVRVSCYPLALWLASSWWRLVAEPSAVGAPPPLAWRLSHQMAAVGEGYLWPRLTFIPDGEAVEVIATPSSHTAAEPLRYLASSRHVIGVGDFERGVDDFIGTVLARLDALGLRGHALETLWAEVRAERADVQVARARALEASLGFDADGAPPSVLDQLGDLEALAGPGAVVELASATGAAQARSSAGLGLIDQVRALATGSGGITARLRVPAVPSLDAPLSGKPWQRGTALARRFRQALSLQPGAVSDETLSQLLGADFTHARPTAPVGLAVRTAAGGATLHFRRTKAEGRRFEVARFLAEAVLAPSSDRWLLQSDAATARQKAQRAFAAEFLAPIEQLKVRLEGDLSADAIDDVAAEFEVSALTVSHQLVNNGVASVDDPWAP